MYHISFFRRIKIMITSIEIVISYNILLFPCFNVFIVSVLKFIMYRYFFFSKTMNFFSSDIEYHNIIFNVYLCIS